MTIREFQAWLTGLQECMGDVPTAAQWARVVEEVGKLTDGSPERAMADGYLKALKPDTSALTPTQQALHERGMDIWEQAAADALEGCHTGPQTFSGQKLEDGRPPEWPPVWPETPLQRSERLHIQRSWKP